MSKRPNRFIMRCRQSLSLPVSIRLPCAVGHKMNWLDFEVKRSKVKVTAIPDMVKLGSIFSSISGIHRRILMKLITITHYQVQW